MLFNDSVISLLASFATDVDIWERNLWRLEIRIQFHAIEFFFCAHLKVHNCTHLQHFRWNISLRISHFEIMLGRLLNIFNFIKKALSVSTRINSRYLIIVKMFDSLQNHASIIYLWKLLVVDPFFHNLITLARHLLLKFLIY